MSCDLRIDNSLIKPANWDDLWKKHFKKYQKDIRHAYYINAVRQRQERRILEIGAGSFRDMATLNRWGLYCEGIDFSAESVARAKENMPILSDKIKRMDATSLNYPDGAFDLTYHNGFWVLFDDERISVLGKEQARVSRYRMIATVHNAHNALFKEKFVKWSKEDPLYRIRFFYVDEIMELMKRFCLRVTVLPVTCGNIDRLIVYGLGPKIIRWAYRFYGRYEPIKKAERLMCIGEI